MARFVRNTFARRWNHRRRWEIQLRFPRAISSVHYLFCCGASVVRQSYFAVTWMYAFGGATTLSLATDWCQHDRRCLPDGWTSGHLNKNAFRCMCGNGIAYACVLCPNGGGWFYGMRCWFDGGKWLHHDCRAFGSFVEDFLQVLFAVDGHKVRVEIRIRHVEFECLLLKRIHFIRVTYSYTRKQMSQGTGQEPEQTEHDLNKNDVRQRWTNAFVYFSFFFRLETGERQIVNVNRVNCECVQWSEL